ncbi:MAG: prolipoprotein diacylglyceryl transferase family protein [Bacillota bacterium]
MIQPTFVRLLGVDLDLFTVTLIAGMAAGSLLAWRLAVARGFNRATSTDLWAAGLLGGLAGARVGHVAVNWNLYAAAPAAVLHLTEGGYSSQGAIIGGCLAIIALGAVKRHPIPRLLDVAAPGAALGTAVARLGCGIYGAPTSVAWAVTVQGVSLHPVQLYSSLLHYGVLVFLWEMKERFPWEGQGALSFLVLSSLGRVVIEGFKAPSPLVTTAQAPSTAALVLALLSLLLLSLQYVFRSGLLTRYWQRRLPARRL